MGVHRAADLGILAQLNLVVKFAPQRIDETNHYGETPLRIAARNYQEAAISLLLSAKADVNATNNSGQTPLHYAAGRDQEATVSLLLSAKADVNKTDSNGTTPLGFASGDRVKQLLRDAGGH